MTPFSWLRPPPAGCAPSAVAGSRRTGQSSAAKVIAASTEETGRLKKGRTEAVRLDQRGDEALLHHRAHDDAEHHAPRPDSRCFSITKPITPKAATHQTANRLLPAVAKAPTRAEEHDHRHHRRARRADDTSSRQPDHRRCRAGS